MLTHDDIVLLEQRQRELLTLFLEESDKSKWPSTDTKDGRGDRVWMKKNAQATLMLVDEIRRVLAREAPDDDLLPASQERPLEEIRRDAEERAARMTGRNGTVSPH